MSLLVKVARKTEGVIHAISITGGRAGGVMLALMVVLIVIDVVGRSAFNSPLAGDVDLVEMLMVLMIFLSVAFTASEKRHVTVDIVVTRLSKKMRARLEILTSFGSLLFVGLMTWQIGARACGLLTLPRYSPSLFWPLAPFYFIAALGCLMLWLELVLIFFSSLVQALQVKKEK